MSVLNVAELALRAPELRAGEEIELTGEVLCARDAAHKRLCALIAQGLPLPVELKNACIYYAGPTPARPGGLCGAFGPTTSARMDRFAPLLYERGVLATVGKGERGEEVKRSIVARGGLYLVAIGGAGALAAEHVSSVRELAFSDLGCESLKLLEFEKFPLFVGIDSRGNDIFAR